MGADGGDGSNEDLDFVEIYDASLADEADEDACAQSSVANLFPFALDGRANGTQDIPVGRRINTLDARSGALHVTLYEASGWSDARVTVRLVNVWRSEDAVRPCYARDAVAVARLSSSSVGRLLVVPFGDIWPAGKAAQGFLRIEQGATAQGTATGLIDVQLVTRSSASPKVTPRSFANLALLLRADHGIVAQGDRVSSWQDQSGYQRDAAQGTAAQQPLWTDGALNDQPGVYFDATRILATPAFALSTFTVFLVFRASNAGLVYEHSPDVNANDGSWVYTTTGSTIAVRRGATISGKNLTANWGADSVNRIVRHQFDGTHAGHKLFINGTDQTLTDTVVGNPGTGASSLQQLFVGARSGVVAPLNGYIMELIVYSPQLTDADAQSLERNYLSPRYGIAVA